MDKAVGAGFPRLQFYCIRPETAVGWDKLSQSSTQNDFKQIISQVI